MQQTIGKASRNPICWPCLDSVCWVIENDYKALRKEVSANIERYPYSYTKED
jgi:hypothetical protein